MKRFSQAVALVAVTTLFATAFTTSNIDHHINAYTDAIQPDTKVAQVVVIGKRMSNTEKNQYDAQANEIAHQAETLSSGHTNSKNRTPIAVK